MQDTPTEQENRAAPVRPLTRIRKDGAPYIREPRVEKEIAALREITGRERRERLLLRNRDDSDFVSEETLVYFLRESARSDDTPGDTPQEAWEIAEALVERVAGHVARQVGRWRLGSEDTEDCVRDLYAALYDALFDLSPTGEFWEVRFWVCLDRRLWNLVERRQNALDQEVRLGDRDGDAEADNADPLAKAVSPEPSPEMLAQYQEALTLLSEREYRAVYLRYMEGLPEESEDPERASIAGALGVTGRSVRNYLRRAEAKLRDWQQSKEEKEEQVHDFGGNSRPVKKL